MLNIETLNADQLDALAQVTADYMERGYTLIETQTDVRVMRGLGEAYTAPYVSIWIDAEGAVTHSDY